MSSLAERLRVRSENKPRYKIDDSDDDFDSDFEDKKKPSVSATYSRRTRSRTNPRKKIILSDDDDDDDEADEEEEASCNACGNYDNLLSCETCTTSYHPKCLTPSLKGPLPSSWRCPHCVGPFNDVEKILDCETRPTVTDDTHAPMHGSDQVLVKQYLVKWKGQSYLHCTWVPETEFTKAYKSNPRLRTKINNFYKQTPSTNNQEDEFVAIRPEWTTVDRIIACREGEEEKEYLVKWNELSYDECYWELESDIASFRKEIERFNKLHSQRGKASVMKQKSNVQDAMDSKKKHKEFQQYDSSPDFLSGGSLHPYQLEGLNFLRFAWSNQTHVILADEMGLGKTIQSIAFLASLFEENMGPHLVVAPLSTLRNWEREFALWAPHMNVVMYVGSAQARSVIREYEFYYPKTEKSIKKKKKSAHGVSKNKNDRIKFDVLLTSYEMINFESTSLKPIKWECMIVDEGHRLKNKDSKLFSMLTKYSSAHRTLLTGTPLQNNLDELFMLMHFLDAGKFGSLEEFQDEFKDINQEEQISRLHKMLAPHLLRRVKKDVMKELPPKRELILRVDLSSKQKEYYKAILTRNYEILARKGGAQISLINVVMELRKLCCHPFMLEGVEPDDPNEFNKQLLEVSGKLHLLDKMMVKLKEQGHRVLIYSQFQHMLDLLEDYCTYRKWQYERIDGRVGGAERQIRIDRFNATNSSRFCFLLSTRAGGLGINLATADTVIIYDSDWNPHADLQAMARAHRLGQTKKVMIFRLITRGTIEERMMQMTKKKMVLEHLVVGKLKTQNINQEELDDIIRYGSKELFEDENDELVKSLQIHYDDAAIDSLLNRDQVVDEDTSTNEEEEHGFLKAFKVANFEYVNEAELAAEEEPPVQPTEGATSANTSGKLSYWEDLLRDKYQVHKTEQFSALGKGRRSRKQMTSIEKDDAANVEDASSGGQDDSYEAELTDESVDGDDDDDEFADSDAASTGAAAAKKTNKKRAREVSNVPLMEGEGKSLRVRGFNQKERAAFLKILMRFGAGEYDWAEFLPSLKPKTKKEIQKYGELFLDHLVEPINDSPTFKDGVPKEGLRVGDVLVRMATVANIRDKVKESTDGSVQFAEDILARQPQLRGGKHWKQSHDLILLQAILKHGYAKWQAIAEDKDLGIQDVICQQLSIPIPGTTQSQNSGVGTSQAQPTTVGIPQTHGGNETGAGGATGSTATVAQDQLYGDYKMMQSHREIQRRQVEFIKKRVLLLEKGLIAQLAKIFYFSQGDGQQAYNMPNDETGLEVEDYGHPITEGSVAQIISQLPRADPISSAEISAVAVDGHPDRLKTASLYNEMNKVVTRSTQESVEACFTNKPSFILGSNFTAMEVINQEVKQIFSPAQQSSPLPATDTEDHKANVENLSSSFANHGGNFVFGGASSGSDMGSSAMETDSAVEKGSKDVEMKEEQD